jgi:putative DNA methylase
MSVETHPVISPKKLIEVALPLDAINKAAAREKSIRHGHPSTLHLWWARRPLAAARAVIFGQLVHDPEDLWRCQNPGKEANIQVKGHWTRSRTRLFDIIERLVQWENTTDEAVLKEARDAIRESWRQTCELNQRHPQAAELFNPNKMPGLHDPFAGGGAIPLEAQRLGLEAYASDLNPVAVLINKAMIEIPPKFAGRPPVHPAARKAKQLLAPEWKGAAGLAEDVRHYGQWMRDEAEKRIGHLYPKVTITKEMVAERPDLKPMLGEELTVIAWLWARTVKSPNPAYAHIDVPLASSFVLSSKEGKEAYVEPVIKKDGYRFTVKVGKPPEEAKAGTKLARGANFKCLMSGLPMDDTHIYSSGTSGAMGARLMAIVAEGSRGRVYLRPEQAHEDAARRAKPEWKSDLAMPENPRWFSPPAYGLKTYGDLFTPRQLVALTTFSDLVGEARDLIRRDAIAAGLLDDDLALEAGGSGARAYAEGVCTILAFSANKLADYGCTISTWMPRGTVGHAFSKQAIPMTWDFPEANPLSDFHCAWLECVAWGALAVETCACSGEGVARQVSATEQVMSESQFVSTDPPYYDNIGYADLSDFFYVWLRRSLKFVYPTLLSTIAVPKAEELVATPYRHGSKDAAEKFFLEGMTFAMGRLSRQSHPSSPITIYYAFKQSESDNEGTNSAGWETFLAAVIRSGLALTGTWPMRTERGARSIGIGTNALASSIILVCRPRAKDAGTISRRQFVRLLNEMLPAALDAMTRADEGKHSPVAPVDLSQAIIGPGMAIFSRYDAVLEADGSPMTVKTALQLINRFLAGDDFDADTQFCLEWFDLNGWEVGKFGEANTIAQAKGTSVEGVKQAGVVQSGGGKVQLLRWKDYAADWDPTEDSRMPVWEALHQLIRAHKTRGDIGAAKVLAAVASKVEAMRQLAYRLYTLCERKGWAEDARAYNEVITGWTGIEQAVSKEPTGQQGQLNFAAERKQP